MTFSLIESNATVQVIVNETGSRVAWNDYDAYGTLLENRNGTTGGVDLRFKFSSKERDNITGYDYFGARYFDRRTARWLTLDPKAEKYPSWSGYNYTLSNPLRYVDRLGMEVILPDPWLQNPEGEVRRPRTGVPFYDEARRFASLMDRSEKNLTRKEWAQEVAKASENVSTELEEGLKRGTQETTADIVRSTEHVGPALKVGGLALIGSGAAAPAGKILFGVGQASDWINSAAMFLHVISGGREYGTAELVANVGSNLIPLAIGTSPKVTQETLQMLDVAIITFRYGWLAATGR